MLDLHESAYRLFDVPRMFFTLYDGNPRSARVVEALTARLSGSAFRGTCRSELPPQLCRVFASEEDVRRAYEGGIAASSAVVLFDAPLSGRFRPTTATRSTLAPPYWSYGAQWVVQVGQRCVDDKSGIDDCAQQLAAMFCRNYSDRLSVGLYPWGPPKKNEAAPTAVHLPDHTSAVVARLNDGPDLAASIADKAFAVELPHGSKISWFRVPPDPLRCDTGALRKVVEAFGSFERACSKLVRTDGTEIVPLLAAGVDVDPEIRALYLRPSAEQFSVRRPDLHWTGTGMFASENDEMPGGFAECMHLDRVYGVNQARWGRCVSWLTRTGPLLFLVSHEWSRCYIPEVRWLADTLRAERHPVLFRTTDCTDDVTINERGVRVAGESVATIWRYFPVFEVRGLLADIVRAAHEGRVRLVPEFAHFGNKTWFSIFRTHEPFFRSALDAETYGVLDAVLPESRLVRSVEDFPFTVDGIALDSLGRLCSLPEVQRDRLVLKLAGANMLSARSYGVLMGHGLSQETWTTWIHERLQQRQPFIVQRRAGTAVGRIPVYNTIRRCAEAFSCRILIRPWMIGGELVTASCCAVPSNTLRVHGRVDMAQVSVALDES